MSNDIHPGEQVLAMFWILIERGIKMPFCCIPQGEYSRKGLPENFQLMLKLETLVIQEVSETSYYQVGIWTMSHLLFPVVSMTYLGWGPQNERAPNLPVSVSAKEFILFHKYKLDTYCMLSTEPGCK